MRTPYQSIRILAYAMPPAGENVNIQLPGPQPAPAAQRQPGAVYVEDYVPDIEPCHLALGRFIHEWSRFERTLDFLLQALLNTDEDRARAIAYTTSGKALRDVLEPLGSVVFDEVRQKEFVNLLERFSSANSRRNVIVHGRWTMEMVTYQKDGELAFSAVPVREKPSVDPTIRDAIANPKNQKIRVKFVYTLKRLEGATRDVVTLSEDFVKFRVAAFGQ